MPRLAALTLVPLLAALLIAAPADARVLQLYGQAQGGGGTGKGMAGAQKDRDFFAGVAGAAYGALVGVEIVFLDVWVEHDQWADRDGVRGTWTQALIGLDTAFPVGDASPGGRSTAWAEVGFAVGGGLGTGQQVEPPLDKSEVSDKGFLAQVRLGLEARLTDVVSLGLAVPVTYGFLVKNGVPADDPDNQYHSLHALGLGYLRVSIGL